ncbi:T9SS type A sorting domain-containing protein [Spirosoma panaciterrae]|uniref:T9SS type A sorting domain-containing protein n=1 Tax=Spirosoma panaciterrae TaxID=496058 RepID=UPI001B7FA98F|nr:T9SS type A sorting domain-containing protein [Spirosoma panaciterrae]
MIANISTLPVSLVSFSAKTLDNNTIQLNWSTAWENSNKAFYIERSTDLRQFESVGQITDVSGDIQAISRYTFIDQKPIRGISYYRLTQADLSGQRTTFPAVSVILRDVPYSVWPNPMTTGELFTLSLDEPQTASVKLYGVNGQMVPLQKVGVESGNLLLRSSGHLSAGAYLLTVEERGQSRQYRLVVQ